MTTATIKESIIYGLGEGAQVSNTTMLAYALRWANSAYRDIMVRHRFNAVKVRTIFQTTDGQQTYHVPANFVGFMTIKDEESNNIIEQITPEDMARRLSTTSITNESWTSSSGVAVSLSHKSILQYSETVTTVAGTTTYTRDTDYSMDYVAGTCTMIATGSMTTATAYYIDYVYYEKGCPERFSVEYDSTNERYIVRVEPTPDSAYICSMLYSAGSSDLSSTVNPIWNRFEYALERGGIFFGSLEIIEDVNKRQGFQMLYEQAVASLIRLDLDLSIPKRNTIPIALTRSQYYGLNNAKD